jgi:oligopeptide/dipeptide ABC transporter ATP-binding protein
MAVMNLGKFFELTDTRNIISKPCCSYNQGVISAIPVPDKEAIKLTDKEILEGDISGPLNPPVGCNFNTRSPFAEEIRDSEEPVYQSPQLWWIFCTRRSHY